MRYLFFSLLLLGVAMGCGKRTETITGADGAKMTVTQQGDQMQITVKGPDGKTVQIASGGSVKLPEGFPGDVPLYPDAKIIASSKTKETMNVHLTTSDSSQKVMEFYEGKLKDHGWEIEGTFQTPQGSMINASKEKRTCMVHIGHERNQTNIVLVVTQREK